MNITVCIKEVKIIYVYILPVQIYLIIGKIKYSSYEKNTYLGFKFVLYL